MNDNRQTKWSILIARRDELQRQLNEAQSYLDGLEGTRCGLKCAGCGTELPTEADFAKHFIVPDSRYLNLGNCPGEPHFDTIEDTVSTELTTDPWAPPGPVPTYPPTYGERPSGGFQ